ncbi:MAG: hypothetical protein H8E44_03510, partial [Planctomycetes bacterium]|nr:hypothetical protein [Planctomycetota bacterium]
MARTTDFLHFQLPALVLAMPLLAGCGTIRHASLADVLSAEELARVVRPSNARNWIPNLAVLPRAELNGNLLTVFNIRNTKYLTADDYIVRHYDKTFDLNKLQSVDFT